MNNIVLCGFMGCGKSTVGKILAGKTGRSFVDMDAYIEKKSGMKISEIFEARGEEGFRELEYDACRELAASENYIIATGGGAFTFERNVRAFKGKDIIVLINVPLEVIKMRLKNDKTRPLLQRPDRDAAMKELYEKRLPLYKKAADVVVTGRNTPLKTAYAVINATKSTKRKYYHRYGKRSARKQEKK